MRSLKQLRAIILKLKRGSKKFDKKLDKIFTDHYYQRVAGRAVMRSLRKNKNSKQIKDAHDIISQDQRKGFARAANYLDNQGQLSDRFAGNVFRRYRNQRLKWHWPEE